MSIRMPAEQGVSTGTTGAWARYVCADGPSKNVSFNAGGIVFMYANFHLSVEGSCFNFNTTINFGQGGASQAQRTSNIQITGGTGCARDAASTDCLSLYGINVKGARNILVKNANYGPNVICAKNDPAVPRRLPLQPEWPYRSSRNSRTLVPPQPAAAGTTPGPARAGSRPTSNRRLTSTRVTASRIKTCAWSMSTTTTPTLGSAARAFIPAAS